MQTGLTHSAGRGLFPVRARSGFRSVALPLRSAAVLTLLIFALGTSVSTFAATTPAPAQVTSITMTADSGANSAANGNTRFPDSANGSAATTSAADLSLFGILALGIIGLLWVRRHTSEL